MDHEVQRIVQGKGTDAEERMRFFMAACEGDADAILAEKIMALMGQRSPQEIRDRLTQMRVASTSHTRAEAAPTTLRYHCGPDDIVRHGYHQPYANFFAVEEYDMTFRRFDGSHSPVINRAVFISGDAVTVLPYDPVRDRVLLVEQFRAGPYGRGDPQPWQLESIAGRIDAGETPEEAARREAVEESGLHLEGLLHVSNFYASPGAKAEFLYSYVAVTDLPDGTAGIFGEESEAEDIRGHLIPFQQMMDLIASGEIQNGPLILTALWLQRERDAIRASG